ncbi:MAG: GNAT family N-acetyltransferase [Synechococcales cyanobacterium CRU_2_2]|nr:GNAT family N-acetyltransferase [Synechococcales cyanobacterium CRU_2_2]
MDETLIIRLVEPPDYEAVWEIFSAIATAGETYVYAPNTTRAEAIALWIEAPSATYVAVQSGRVLGTYYLKPNQPGLGSHVCNCGYMVSPGARGRGVATALGNHSQAEAQRLGFRAMQFNCVVSTNTTAVRLWQKLGFKIVGTLPGAFRHRQLGFVDAYVMYQQFNLIQDEAFGIIPVFWPLFSRVGSQGSGDASELGVVNHQYLLIRHQKGHWGFPKGHREAKESAEQTAQREFQEETGLPACRLMPELRFTEEYRFLKQKRGQWVEKTVVYFVGEVLPDPVGHINPATATAAQHPLPKVEIQQQEISEFRWCRYEEALALLTHEVGRQMLRQCEAALTQH